MAKRQLGLAEAFLNAASGGVARPAKRARTASPPPPPAPTTSTAPTSIETNDLRSSFSVSQWRASLATEAGGPNKGSSDSHAPSEADLLALEAMTLHPSWLEHLQDELRKPYFLELKRFLWSEGLRGTQDRQGGKLKVFPPGARALTLFCQIFDDADSLSLSLPSCDPQRATYTPGPGTPPCAMSKW